MQSISWFLKLLATTKTKQVDVTGLFTLLSPYLVEFYTLLQGASRISDYNWGSAQRLHYHLGTQQKLPHLCNISALLFLKQNTYGVSLITLNYFSVTLGESSWKNSEMI